VRTPTALIDQSITKLIRPSGFGEQLLYIPQTRRENRNVWVKIPLPLVRFPQKRRSPFLGSAVQSAEFPQGYVSKNADRIYRLR